MNKSKIILLSTLAVLSLTACSSKSETSPQSVAETPAPVATSTPTPQPTATPIPENHDFDLYIDQFKDENNIDINPNDDGTDIPDTLGSTGNEVLHDWLYNNGVTRESVQKDRDSGCKNPYLDGYLEYLDSLVDKQIAEDNAGQVESSAKGDGLGGTEIINGYEFKLDSDGGGTLDGVYYSSGEIDYIRKQAEGQAERDAANKARSEEMQKNSEKLAEAFGNKQQIQDFINELNENN